MTHWIGASWKMHKTLAEARAFACAVLAAKIDPRIQPFVLPPFTCLREVKDLLRPSPVKVGAQNMHWLDEGAWTGEISPLMLKDCGADMVEIGHVERRMHFGETDETVGLKTEAAVRNGLVPLICIGESSAERRSGQAGSALKTQVRGALSKLSQAQKNAPILFAYEPVWAIGDHGIPATSDYADARHAEIIAAAGDVLGRKVPCLYGGSVNLQNCEDLITCRNISGLFIGRSAWNVAGYLEILAKCAAKL